MSAANIQIGNVVELQATITRNGGLPWGLPSLASCQFLFVRPDGTQFTTTAVIDDPNIALVHYNTLPTDINQLGQWGIYLVTLDALGRPLTSPVPFTFPILGTE